MNEKLEDLKFRRGIGTAYDQLLNERKISNELELNTNSLFEKLSGFLESGGQISGNLTGRIRKK